LFRLIDRQAIRGALLWGLAGFARLSSTYRAAGVLAQDGGGGKATRVTVAVLLLSRHASLFQAYRHWYNENGIRYPLTSRLLAKKLRELGWKYGRTGESKCFWRGVEPKDS
jgi:hypothetical protein